MNGSTPVLNIECCNQEDFIEVISFIHQMQLDENDLKQEQFLIAKWDEKLIGFGRLRKYADCEELCSLGVIEPYRNKGVGTFLAKELLKKRAKPIYVVTVLPEFFARLGFEEVAVFPPEIGSKINYCTGSLPVKETYRAMRFIGDF